MEVKLGSLSHAQKEVGERKVFTDGEIQILLAVTERGSFWHATIAIGRWIGLGPGDICGLEWDSFEKLGKIIVWTQKRNLHVELPLQFRVLADAVAGIAIQDKVYCFPQEREVVRDPKKRSIFSVQFMRLC